MLRHNDDHWTDANGEILSEICKITPLTLKLTSESNSNLDGNVQSQSKNNQDEVDEKQILAMPELNPPPLMPNGNVGTPTLVFLDLIQKCLLPNNLISKLKLKFPMMSAKRLYGNVNFEYDSENSQECGLPVNSKLQMDRSLQKLDRTKLLIHRPSRKLITNKSQRNALKNELKQAKETCGFNDNFRMQVNSSLEKDQKDKSSCGSSLQVSPSFLIGVRDSPSNDSTLCMSDSHTEENNSVSSPSEDTRNKCSSLVDNPLTQKKAFFIAPNPQSVIPLGKCTNREKKRLTKEDRKHTQRLMAEGIEERFIAVEKRYHSDSDAEEWDRHEASEDDPSNQERNKERLYEEDIEQPWEKGGAGVNFYTDAIYWQQQEGDFDEQTTDDLDVDFSAYEEPGSGDKDIKDFIKIQQETRFRNGYDSTDRFSIGIGRKLDPHTSKVNKKKDFTEFKPKIGAFEQYTKGFGRKVMEYQGWQEGQGLGSSRPGIVDALKCEGQKPFNKRGLGYIDEIKKNYGASTSKKSREPHHITTIYDNPNMTDPKIPLLQRQELSRLKHRSSHLNKFNS
ncbi:unnamed protein product [Lymnaea stagnalis]|uniref:G-patch domain-containing protein n=1 Tax=Lymnaea stagnalis TaxID=6523 RepID=A0AAV2HIJ7_LYMST